MTSENMTYAEWSNSDEGKKRLLPEDYTSSEVHQAIWIAGRRAEYSRCMQIVNSHYDSSDPKIARMISQMAEEMSQGFSGK